MSILSDGVSIGALPRRLPEATQEGWRTYAHRRLDAVYASAPELPFSDSARIIFMSDCHRGDGSRADAFVRNRTLFLHVLTDYYNQGYTYVEVGDGDELWKGWGLQEIRQVHKPVFDLLHRFDCDGRLHLIVGNHDLDKGRGRRSNGRGNGAGPVTFDKDGLAAHEGLLLRHCRTGQRLFVIHGHQADLKSDYLSRVSRLAVGYVWTRLQLLGLVEATSQMNQVWKLKRMERAIMSWAAARQQAIICGHTHRPMSAVHGEAPYFNAGSCVFPGCITGLELANGEISLVSWRLPGNTRQPSPSRLERQLVAPPRKLSTLLSLDSR